MYSIAAAMELVVGLPGGNTHRARGLVALQHQIHHLLQVQRTQDPPVGDRRQRAQESHDAAHQRTVDHGLHTTAAAVAGLEVPVAQHHAGAATWLTSCGSTSSLEAQDRLRDGRAWNGRRATMRSHSPITTHPMVSLLVSSATMPIEMVLVLSRRGSVDPEFR
ncbi:MAG: hypothetical protein U5N53_12885 [Mycobacterium sp.]|nr:hypothetical protein [Mycobacterium sp.]